MPTETRQLLIERNNGKDLKITIPADFKVTFGQVQPGKGGGYGEGFALRIYKTEKDQRAVFTNVKSFRDLAIPVEEKIVQRTSESKNSSNGKGKAQHIANSEAIEEWEIVK